MSKGYPDYFGQSIWPKYGGMINDNGNFDIIGLDTVVLTSYTGQGVLVFLDFEITDDDLVGSCSFEAHVDGVPIQIQSLNGFRDEGPQVGNRSPLVCRFADKVTGVYILNMGIDVPFRTSFEIQCNVAAGNTVHVSTYVGYYAVT